MSSLVVSWTLALQTGLKIGQSFCVFFSARPRREKREYILRSRIEAKKKAKTREQDRSIAVTATTTAAKIQNTTDEHNSQIYTETTSDPEYGPHVGEKGGTGQAVPLVLLGPLPLVTKTHLFDPSHP